jgi:aminoglycoside phosphotransferase (APT) family kinase protein
MRRAATGSGYVLISRYMRAREPANRVLHPATASRRCNRPDCHGNQLDTQLEGLVESRIMTGPLHHDELPVTLPLVRALVESSFPELAALPLRPLESTGSSNALFRLGNDLVVRLPRQPGGTATIDKEARWLPIVGPRLPVAVPEIVAVGEPALGYGERWSIVRWLSGVHPPAVGPNAVGDPQRHRLAEDLAEVVLALERSDVPRDARMDPDLRWYRGEPVVALAESTFTAIEQCRQIPGLGLDLDSVAAVWAEVVAAHSPGTGREARWFHGDLVAENLLVAGGRLSAVLDFGGLSVGDPTVDLVAAWEVLDPPARETFRRLVDVDEPTWERARAWALALGLMTFPYYWDTMPGRCANRLAMVRSVLAEVAR